VTPSERRLYAAFRRVAASVRPDLQRAYLRAWELVRAALAPSEVERLLATTGNADAMVRRILTPDVLERAFRAVEAELQRAAAEGAALATRQLPPAARRVLSTGTATVGFNVLDPRVTEAVRALQIKHVASQVNDVREVVRAFVEDGLRDGVNPRTVARRVRGVVGLGPSQRREVQNFRTALETGDASKALTYARRDRRFDARIRRGDLTPAQIDQMVERYTQRRIALNAETAARTTALDSLKAGQRLAWEDAVRLGVVDRDRLRRRWVTTLDGRERPAHQAMNGVVVRFDEPFNVPGIGPQMTPGESEYNCRCLAVVFESRNG
jgi:hypothetical protein